MAENLRDQLAERFERLEQENRRLGREVRGMRWLGAFLVIGVAGVGLMGAKSPDNVAGSPVISDPQDNDCRIVLVAGDNGTTIAMHDNAGVLRAQLNSGTAGQFLKFFDGQGQPVP